MTRIRYVVVLFSCFALLTSLIGCNSGGRNGLPVGAGGGTSTGTTPTILSISPDVGGTPGGTTVTINTADFTDDFTQNPPQVTFGGQAGTNIQPQSATEITVDTPSHAAGQVDVVVTGTQTTGDTATQSNGFTYRGITAVTPASGPIPGGTQITIQTIGFTNLQNPTVEFSRGAAIGFGGGGTTTETLTNVQVNGSTITATTPQAAPNPGNGSIVDGGIRNVDVSTTNPTESDSLANGFRYTHSHLLITEVCVTPSESEFIEIHNPTANTVNLTNYWLTDGTNTSNSPTDEYWKLASATQVGMADALDDGGGADFLVQFPNGAQIAPGAYQTIAIDAGDFNTTFGQDPTYFIRNQAGTTSTAMVQNPMGTPAGLGSITLTNGAETVVLFNWDGNSDLVQDVDYVIWGTDTEDYTDKSGETNDGPDANATPSAYANDTAPSNQIPITASAPHPSGASWGRGAYAETGETNTGGNGITGHDETSENLDDALGTWFETTAPTPGAP